MVQQYAIIVLLYWNKRSKLAGNTTTILTVNFIRKRLLDIKNIQKKSDVEMIEAAVLVPLVQKDDEWHLLFTLRTDTVKDHKGQVSFPGGMKERDDADLLRTALRETKEEIGVDESDIEILGILPAFDSSTNYFITPIIARMNIRKPLVLEKREVQKTFVVPLAWLADKDNWQRQDYQRENGRMDQVIVYNLFECEKIWGITARIVHMLIDQIGK